MSQPAPAAVQDPAEIPDEPDAAAPNGAVAPAAGSNSPDETNVWPDEAAEAAFLSEARGRGENPQASRAAVADAAEEASPKALPSLDELVKRIPPDARELLDELFRARFTAVRRVKKTELKS